MHYLWLSAMEVSMEGRRGKTIERFEPGQRSTDKPA